jgi:lipoyl-dependent peroxiredoxin
MALSFALAQAGFAEGTLQTEAKVKLEQDGDGGFKVTRSDLDLKAEVPGISPEQFETLARGAEQNCPISKLLNAEITLNFDLA